MRIAFFADINDNHNQKWIRLLAERHSIVVFTLENNSIKDHDFINKTDIKVYSILPNAFTIINIFKKHTIISRIESILSENNIQIIHSIYSIPYSLWAGLVETENHIITTYGSDMLIDYNLDWKNPASLKQKITFWLLRKTLQKAFNNAKYITSTSVEQQNVIKQFISNDSKLYITRTGVDCEKFNSIYKNTHRETKDFVILSNRAMRPLYNINIILDAFFQLEKKYTVKSFKLVLLNYNTDELFLSSLQKTIQTNNSQNHIEIVNDLTFEELIKCYKNSDIVIMIPRSDGTPVSGVETLLAQKPLIIGDLNYDTDLFNENTVWKINKTDAKTLCDKLIEILNTQSDCIRKKLDNGYLAALKYGSLKSEIEKIEQFYQNIISK